MSTHDIETQIITKLVDDALAKGYRLTVDDGGDKHAVVFSSDRAAILDALHNTDSDAIYVADPETGITFGWIQLVYGNDGYDVISDYTANPAIEAVIAGAEALADQLECASS